MNEQLETLIKDYKQLDWSHLLRGDFGEKYSLKELKPHLDILKNFIDHIVLNVDKLSESNQQDLKNLLNEFNGNIKIRITNHTDTSQTKQLIKDIISIKDQIISNEVYQRLERSVELLVKYDSTYQVDQPELEVDKYKTARKEITKELQKIRKIQSQYAGQIKKEEVSVYGGFFKKESENNKYLFKWFGGLFILFSVLAGWFAHCYLKFDHTIKAQNLIELLIKGDVINKIFIFSVIFLVISVLRKEYLAMRHQYTLNKLRYNALSSHKEILSSIEQTKNESDKEIANAILLELTKAIFHAQDTGFVKNSKNTGAENKIVEISKSLFNHSQN